MEVDDKTDEIESDESGWKQQRSQRKKLKKRASRKGFSNLERDIFNCDSCNFSCKSNEDMTKHREIHSVIECDQCEQKFQNRRDLMSHIVQVHTMERFLCEHCSLSFSNQDTLEKHKQIHIRVQTFGCNNCNEKFSLKDDLICHARIHDKVAEFKCEQCGEIFLDRAILDRHAIRHEQNSSTAEYRCNQCDKTYGDMRKLRRHDWRSHRPIECIMCAETLQNRQEIVNHRRTKHQMYRKTACKFYPDCYDGDECLYEHNIDDGSNLSVCPNGQNCTDQSCGFSEQNHKSWSQTPCKFQESCNRSGCSFKHDSRRGRNPKNKRKIINKKILKQKKSKKKRKRTEIRNKNKNNQLRMFFVNSAGIKCKLDSMNDILKRLKPQIWALQETKLKPNETLKCEAANDFQIFYLNRQNSQGGGIAVGIDKNMESALVREGNDTIEALVVQVAVCQILVNIVVAYGPQENALKEVKEKFWKFLEEEANKAEEDGHGLIIQMDGNLHAGPELIKSDPNPQNNNGKLFMEFLKRNPYLVVANSLDSCKGMITRQRKVQDKTEKSVLDFLLMNDKLRIHFSKMLIDEEREYCLSNFSQLKKNKRVIETDHNALISEFNISVPKRMPDRIEMFNIRNKACQEQFTKITDDCSQLVDCFENELSLEAQSSNWLKLFKNIISQCFSKVRIVKNKNKIDENERRMHERIKLKKEVNLSTISEDVKLKIEERILEIETEIGDKVSKKYHEEIIDTLNKLGGDETNLNGSGRKHLWKMLKKKFPKNMTATPVGKKEKSGQLITNHEGLKKLYLDTYVHRLRNRPIKQEYQEIKDLKNELFELRLELVNNNKSKPWSLEELEFTLEHLKEGKSRDPNGWANELLSNEVAGKHLKIFMLKFFNKMK